MAVAEVKAQLQPLFAGAVVMQQLLFVGVRGRGDCRSERDVLRKPSTAQMLLQLLLLLHLIHLCF